MAYLVDGCEFVADFNLDNQLLLFTRDPEEARVLPISVAHSVTEKLGYLAEYELKMLPV